MGPAKKKTVLFIAEGATLAHLVRPLTLARALDPARYEVHYACPPGFDFVWSKESFRRWEIFAISSDEFQKALASGKRVFDYPTLIRYIEDDRKLIQQVRPDLVVGDFRLSLSISAALEKVKYVTITNAYWSPYSRGNFQIPEHPMNKIFGVTIADALFQSVRAIVFNYHAQLVNRLRAQNGLSHLGDMLHVYTHGDEVLFADTPSLVPTFDLPDNHHYIGPILWSPDVELPAWWGSLNEKLPCVYLTLGSSGKVDTLPTIIKALSELSVEVLWATAGAPIPENLPPNIHAAPYLPGDLAAKKADLVISNGGSPTSYQAVIEDTPVLGVCSNLDQYLAMGFLEKAGAGQIFRAGQVTKDGIKSAVKNLLLEASYKNSARSLSKEFKEYDSGKRFAALVNQWLGP